MREFFARFCKNRFQAVQAFQQNSSRNQNFQYRNYVTAGFLAGAALTIAPEDPPKNDEIKCTERKNISVNASDMKQIQYENKIRRYSKPEKIFRLFATVQVMDSEQQETIYMTPADFVRAITPGEMQPKGLGLDEYEKVKIQNLERFLGRKKFTNDFNNCEVFAGIAKNGLMSFNDYMFLCTVIGTNKKHWHILFKIFDENGDGDVDKGEFERVMKLARINTSAGERHRDTGDNKVKTILAKLSGITGYFFPNEDSKLTLSQFLQFHEKLKEEILKIQFEKEKQHKNDDKITKLSFAKMLLEYMESADTYKELERVKKVLVHYNKKSDGVTFEQINKLYKVLACADDIEMSLDMHTSAKIELSKDTFKHIAWVVAEERIDDNTLDIMWAVFDEDGSGGLSNREFLRQVKNRASFGLDKPTDTGLWRLFHAAWACSKEKVKTVLEV